MLMTSRLPGNRDDEPTSGVRFYQTSAVVVYVDALTARFQDIRRKSEAHRGYLLHPENKHILEKKLKSQIIGMTSIGTFT